MISQWNVLSRFCQLTALSIEQANEFLPICNINLARIYAMTDDNADKNDIRILQAAAALSCYDYALRLSHDADSFTSFKAGDITVSKTENAIIESAEKLKNNALAELVPLMKDTRFVFTSVNAVEDI